MAGLSGEKAIVLTPQVDIKSETDAVQLVYVGPVAKAPYHYPASSATANGFLWQNVQPSNPENVMDRGPTVTYQVGIGLSWCYYFQPTGDDAATTTASVNAAPMLPAGGNWRLPTMQQHPTYTQGGQDNKAFYNPATGSPIFTFRSLPLNSITQNAEVKINGYAISTPSSILAPLISQGFAKDKIPLWATTYPCGRDDGPFLGYTTSTLSGPAKGTSNINDIDTPRDAMVKLEILELQNAINAPNARQWGATAICTNATFIATITEPFIASPFRYGNTFEQPGLSRIYSLSIQLTLERIKRMIIAAPFRIGPYNNATAVGTVQWLAEPAVVLSGSTGDITNSPQVAAVAQVPPAAGGNPGCTGAAACNRQIALMAPTLNTLVLNPDALTLSQQPAFMVTSTESTQVYRTPFAFTPAFDQQTDVTSATIVLSTVPATMWICGIPNGTAMGQTGAVAAGGQRNGYQMEDFALSISKITVNALERVGILLTYYQPDLYRMAVQNGYAGTYAEWRTGSGAFLPLSFVNDLCMATGETDGQKMKTNFQVTVTFDAKEQFAAAGRDGAGWFPTQWELVLIPVVDAKLAIGGNSAQLLIEGSTGAQVRALLAQSGPKLWPSAITTEQTQGQLHGGGFFDHVRSFANGLAKGVHSAAVYGDKIAGHLRTASQLVNSVMGGRDTGGDLMLA